MRDDTCAVGECERAAEKRGWCNLHYRRWRRHGDPLVVLKQPNGAAPDHCTVQGCDDPHHARGLCVTHYSRKRRSGDPLTPTRPYGDFWARVDKTGDCWVWTGFVNATGYGFANGVLGRGQAHRVVYEALVGTVPAGLDLDHLCHNRDPNCVGGVTCLHRRCVNPAHLEPVDRSTNMLRAFARTGPREAA